MSVPENGSSRTIPPGSKILGNVAFYQHQISNYSQDMLHNLADNYKSQFVLSDNILKSMMPQTVEQCLGLTAMLALMLNPPGDAAIVGGTLAIGGEQLLNDAPNHPERYEVASDIRNDRLAIWDKETSTMTIFNPKGNKDTKGLGTVFKLGGGYRIFEEVKNGRQ
ncbi:hypothetical protein GLF_2494 [Gluconobacter frateurii NBRC 101659]|nr:hypothetical protein GLF_2494 [Gluconobacter frateurii NBRC 101659]